MARIEQVFGFFMPSITLIGYGAAKEIPARIKALGAKKPLIVTDQGIVKSGILATVEGYLKEQKMAYAVYADTVPNPTDENVHKGVDVYKKHNCDALITLGGGSSHDCGKGIGLVVANGGKIHDFEGVDKSTKPFVPYLAVNTTAGTASEMTRFCIITDLSRHVKMAIVDWRCTPNIAIDDPALMLGMPPALTAATGMDALTHAVEAYVSTAATPMTDASAEKCIWLVGKYLRKAVALGSDAEAREMMAHAQYLGGMAFNNASLGYVHAMAHQLGGFYDLPHGECNAILLPYVSEFNINAKMERFAKIAELLGECTCGKSEREAAYMAIDAIRKLSADVSIPAGLKALGKRYGKNVQEKDVAVMTGNAQKDACMLTNPRSATDPQVTALYMAAM
ncbi:MAG: iron-containing alcohol dehydrogenase [Proteobacteria bacterium]|nr:iron-containing alcohol dehydrogenase [Pseudomonadota bacterium]